MDNVYYSTCAHGDGYHVYCGFHDDGTYRSLRQNQRKSNDVFYETLCKEEVKTI